MPEKDLIRFMLQQLKCLVVIYSENESVTDPVQIEAYYLRAPKVTGRWGIRRPIIGLSG